MILISLNQIIARLVSMYYHVSNCINDDDITSHHIAFPGLCVSRLSSCCPIIARLLLGAARDDDVGNYNHG